MTKHTQTICSQVLSVNCQNVFDHLVGLVLKGLRQDVFMVIPSTSAESKKLSLISPKDNNSIAVLANKEKNSTRAGEFFLFFQYVFIKYS